jgi:hypothetical protein
MKLFLFTTQTIGFDPGLWILSKRILMINSFPFRGILMNLTTGKISSFFPRHISSDWQSALWQFRNLRNLSGNLPMPENLFMFSFLKEELNA